MTTNPAHTLMARNSRGPHNLQLSSPTETHAAASGVFRAAGSPTWQLEEMSDSASDADTDSSEDDGEDIAVHETFTRAHKFPGTVKIVVEGTTFWAHKEILYFACPFFEAALGGGWLETGRPQSVSSVITIAQARQVEGGSTPKEAAVTQMLSDDEDMEIVGRQDGNASASASEGESEGADADAEREREKARAALESAPAEASKTPASPPKVLRRQTAQAKVKRKASDGVTATIVLKEERASIFHDFLRYIYPHIECTITWMNVEGLMNISHKLCVPALTKECSEFLFSHAAGRPIKAMRIAEIFEEEEIYREASRFILDNPGGWSDDEMGTLTRDTLLKLEKRRTWFLERVLKLGLTQIAKEYQCCSTCPDPSACARTLDEKWRQAYHQVFRFGPCQPSMVFRYLRSLEGISPPLSLTHLNCQNTAKTFVATLFDRMFSLGMRGTGTETTPIGARVAVVASGPRRHFLYCTLKTEAADKKKKNKEVATSI